MTLKKKKAAPKKAEAKEPKSGKPSKIMQLLLDAETPLEMRLEILRQWLMGGEEEGIQMLQAVLNAAASAQSEDLFEAKKEELAQLMKQMMEGPLRQATFERLVQTADWGLRAEVRLPDGQPAFTPVPDPKLADSLRCGDLVWLEAQGKALLYRQERKHDLGDEAMLERVLPGGSVEVQIGEQGKFVFRVAEDLEKQIELGEAGPGSTVIVCPRRQFAFRALPREDGFAHFRFLCREAIPDVVVERDVACPPAFIEEFTRHLRRELTDPEPGRRYKLRRSFLRLLTGVPGSGKTFSILGWWNRMYAVLSEECGVPVSELPPRVMQLRVSDVFSKWVGESDKNIARFFKEAAELAAQPVIAADGREVEAPILILVEECEAIARQRGDDAIHDRIQSTLLQNLDPGNPLFRDRLVFVLCTTNTPQLVDSAFVRRVGGQIVPFGRLTRYGFRAVLEKQLAGRPFRPAEGSEAEARERALDDLTAWLFAPNSAETGVVELTYVGQTTGTAKYRRDFLTAALIDRAVNEASAEACDAEWDGIENPGLCAGALMDAIDQQVQQVSNRLTPRTCDHHLTLPDGTSVASVRRLQQPTVQPFALERLEARAQ